MTKPQRDRILALVTRARLVAFDMEAAAPHLTTFELGQVLDEIEAALTDHQEGVTPDEVE